MFANEELTRHEAKHVKEKSALFTECIECGQCVEACPQGIDIPNELKKLGEMMGILKW